MSESAQHEASELKKESGRLWDDTKEGTSKAASSVKEHAGEAYDSASRKASEWKQKAVDAADK